MINGTPLTTQDVIKISLKNKCLNYVVPNSPTFFVVGKYRIQQVN